VHGRIRGAVLTTAVVGLAVALLLTGGVLLRPERRTSEGAGASPQSATAPAGDRIAAVTRAQQRLRDVPGDYLTWAELGAAYVQQARVTADPSYYLKAQGALERSIQVRRDGNSFALTGLATLAAARHDFVRALDLGRRSLVIDAYSATTYGVVGDALVELGRYDEAFRAIQRMVDLRPDVASYARASYAWELRGDLTRARRALEQALDAAPAPDDQGFALYYLGELAWNAGDLGTAERRYAEGVRRAPGYLPLQEGRAKVLAARGRTAEAIAAYRTLTERLPQPAYVAELGDLLTATGNDADAAQQYALVRAGQRLLRANGVDTDLELALFDADHGNPAGALRAARAVYATRKGVFAEDALAWALHAAGRDRQALPHARAAQRLRTRSAVLRYHLAMISAALGDRPGAREQLTAALDTNPHFSPLQAPAARTALGSLR
jgi:tetratricopeptide (TPR) repeat protein